MTRNTVPLYPGCIKRYLGIALSFVMFIILSPLLLVTAIIVKLKLGSPVIFKQVRPGYNEKLFTLYKFRTMTNASDENGQPLPDSARQTRFGRFLRKTSIDELPALWNILKGDMAFIGPRPLLVEYLPLYTEEQHRRHNVRPGMANISAITGRNEIAWDERLKMDVWYTENVSFKTDLMIFIKTIRVVFLREGSPDAVTSTRGGLNEYVKDKAVEEKDYEHKL